LYHITDQQKYPSNPAQIRRFSCKNSTLFTFSTPESGKNCLNLQVMSFQISYFPFVFQMIWFQKPDSFLIMRTPVRIVKTSLSCVETKNVSKKGIDKKDSVMLELRHIR